MGGYDWTTEDEDYLVDHGFRQGKRAHMVKLAAVLTAARDGKTGTLDYLRALDDIAEAMDLKRTEKVEYKA